MRFSVKTSLMAVIAVMIAFLLGQGWMAVGKLQAMRTASADVSDNWLPSVRVLGDVKYLITRLRVQDSRHIVNTDDAVMRDIEARMEKTRASIEKAFTTYEPMISSDEERGLWTAFRKDWSGYLNVREALLAASRKNDTAAAAKILNESSRDFDAALTVLEKDIELNNTGAETATTTSRATYDSALNAMLIVGVIAVLAGIGAVFFVIFGVTSPLHALTDAMRAVSQGRLDTAIPSTDRTNEIGDMARTLVVFRDGLADNERMRVEQTRREAETAERIARDRRDIADRFMSTMGSLAESFVKSSGDVAGAARNLSATAEETARQSQAVSHAAEEASSNVQTVAASTEELAASVHEITEQVVHSTRVAQTAAEEAASTEANIRGLSEAAEKIGDVVNLIKDIAGQTNLLALNATIEAARAGEAGKGFAVVASEVKQLAAQTARATDEIAQKIGEIQAATNETVSSIARIVGTIGSIREMSSSIAGAVEEQGAATREISSNTHRAAESAGHVTDNITGVGHAAEMTGSAATQLMSLSSDLSDQAGRLTREVQSFVTTLRSA